MRNSRLRTFDHQLTVVHLRFHGHAEFLHIFRRDFDTHIGQILGRTSEMFRKGDKLQFAGLDFQTGRSLDLHEQLVGVHGSRAHLAAVVLQVERRPRGLGSLEPRVDVVHRGEQHRNKLLAREVFALGQRIGKPQSGLSRNMRSEPAILLPGERRAEGRS